MLELSSVEETARLLKIEKLQINNNECPIKRVGDTLYGGTMSLVNMFSKQEAEIES